MTLCQQSRQAEVVPECDGGAVLYEVLTPRLDHRDPAFAVREWPCPGCPMCEDPMAREVVCSCTPASNPEDTVIDPACVFYAESAPMTDREQGP